MQTNKLIAATNPGYRDKGFAGKLKDLSELHKLQVIHHALVLQVDREGGRFYINRGADGGKNNQYSVIGTLKIRLLTNLYNDSNGTDASVMDMDEYYVLPLNHHHLRFPIAGEVVKVMFDRPMDKSSRVLGYWIGEQTYFATRDYRTTYKYRQASHGKEVTHDEYTIYSGRRPSVIDNDYDVHPNYFLEPFPEDRRAKEGDDMNMGGSNTMIHHSFNAHSEADGEGTLEIGTGYDYIGNVRNKDDSYTPFTDTSFDFDKATDDEIKIYQDLRNYHFQRVRDIDKDKSRWEQLNTLGSRIFLTTKYNIDRRLIHKDTEKDGTGDFGNVQRLYDTNFRDEGPGKNCGKEIEQKQIHDKIDIASGALQGDVVEVQSKARNPITFDDAVPSLLIESEQVRIITRNSERAVNHAVLGEEQLRWNQRLLIMILHQNRTIDILNDRLHRLSVDFVNHIHLAKPGITNAPMGSPESPTGQPITDFTYYVDTTDGSVGGDSSFDEKGSDSPSMLIKDRIKEERKQLEQLIADLPDNLSDSFGLN